MRPTFLISLTTICISLVWGFNNNEEVEKTNTKLVIDVLAQVLNFMEKHYYEINFDGLLGVVIAECKL